MEEQRSPEWFAKRRGRVTGSVAGAILGWSPWQTREEVLRRMVREWHGAENEFPSNAPPLLWGRANEATAIATLEMEHGLDVEECGFFPVEEWLGASPDGLTTVPADLMARFGHSRQAARATVEVKTPYKFRDAENPAFDRLDEQPHYEAQVHLEALCAGTEWCLFYQWAPGGTHLEILPRSDDLIGRMLPELRAFWEEFQEALENPDEHLEPRLRTVATLEADKLVQEYAELQDAADRAKDRLDEIRARLIQLADGKPSIVGGARVVLVERAGSMRAAAVFKRLQELDPTATEDQFRGKPSSSWRITVR